MRDCLYGALAVGAGMGKHRKAKQLSTSVARCIGSKGVIEVTTNA